MKNILSEYWECIEKKETKQAKRIYNYLNKDKLSSIITDGNVYWIETISSQDSIPNYIYDDIKTFCNNKGLTYLYDIKTN